MLGLFHWRLLDMGYVVTPTIVFLPIAPLAFWCSYHIAVACGGFFIPTFPEDISVLNVFQIKSSHLWSFIPNGCFSFVVLLFSSGNECEALWSSGYINCGKCLAVKKTSWNCLFLYNIVFIAKWVLKGACPWVAPRTSRTRSENHTTRPTGRPLWYQLQSLNDEIPLGNWFSPRTMSSPTTVFRHSWRDLLWLTCFLKTIIVWKTASKVPPYF